MLSRISAPCCCSGQRCREGRRRRGRRLKPCLCTHRAGGGGAHFGRAWCWPDPVYCSPPAAQRGVAAGYLSTEAAVADVKRGFGKLAGSGCCWPAGCAGGRARRAAHRCRRACHYGGGTGRGASIWRGLYGSTVLSDHNRKWCEGMSQLLEVDGASSHTLTSCSVDAAILGERAAGALRGCPAGPGARGGAAPAAVCSRACHQAADAIKAAPPQASAPWYPPPMRPRRPSGITCALMLT